MFRFFLIICCPLVVAGCAGKPVAPMQSVSGLTQYKGPRARVAVADFDVQTPKASVAIAADLREMLITALSSSSRFVITGRDTGPAAKSHPALPELTVAVSVAEFEPQASGGTAGVGGGGGVGSGTLGTLLGAPMNKAHLSLAVRVIDNTTSQVVASTRVQGQASDMAGGFMAGFFGGWTLGGSLSMYADSPMEKAIRICMMEATRYITQSIPSGYYRY
ncbi:MAG: CsgG/HfaB family protein [Deltaproteobacteria bacterium]